MLMKCIKCGTELSEGMAFCPTCGAAQSEGQNAGNGSFGNSQQPQQQWQQQSYGQQQYGQQQSFQSQQQWQQQPYEQQSYGQQPQQNQGWNQNNQQGMAGMQKKKSSKTPLIIGLVAAIIIIIGLAVTCIILITSKDSTSKGNSNKGTSGTLASTPEKTVESFLDTLLDWDFSEAVDEYLHPAYIEYLGGRQEALGEWSDIGMEISSYDDVSSKKLSSSELNSVNRKLKELDYDYQITEGSIVEIHIEGPGIHSDDYYVTFIVVSMDGKWYIIDWYD